MMSIKVTCIENNDQYIFNDVISICTGKICSSSDGVYPYFGLDRALGKHDTYDMNKYTFELYKGD